MTEFAGDQTADLVRIYAFLCHHLDRTFTCPICQGPLTLTHISAVGTREEPPEDYIEADGPCFHTLDSDHAMLFGSQTGQQILRALYDARFDLLEGLSTELIDRDLQPWGDQ